MKCRPLPPSRTPTRSKKRTALSHDSIEKALPRSNNSTAETPTGVQKATAVPNENGSTSATSEEGLDEVEFSQSDVDQSPMNVVNGSTDSAGSLAIDESILNGSEGNVEEAVIPLSLRRSERARNRVRGDGQSPLQNARGRSDADTPIINQTNTDTAAEILPGPEYTTVLISTQNAMKAEIMELKRDKRAYSSALVTMREKLDQLIKDLNLKTQQLAAIEDALCRKRGGNSSSGPAATWSLESLSKQGIAQYQGICFAAGKYGTKLAKLLVTETFIDENGDCNQKQDWGPSSTKVSAERAKEAVVFVKLPDGVSAIPTCSMVRGKQITFFTSHLDGPKGLLKASFRSVLDGPVGKYLNKMEREECISKLLGHRPTVQKFRTVMSDAVGSRKKAARNTYLKSLGYKYVCMPDSKKDTAVVKDLRAKEKSTVIRRCLNPSNENDTSYWRTSEWEELFLIGSSPEIETEMNDAEKDLEKEGKVDNLFLNEAARRAFIVMRGFSISNTVDEFAADTSILHLARADASMTTMLKFISVGGKGGSRNDQFVETFRDLLPKALSVIIRDIWSDLQSLASHELHIHIGNSTEDEADPYGNNVRDWTVVQNNPHDNHIYLLASPRYFKRKVCSWYGTLKDAHIGRYNSKDKKFDIINSTLSFDELEESDVEDSSVED